MRHKTGTNKIIGITFLVISGTPGLSQKVLLTDFPSKCFQNQQYDGIAITTSAWLSPPLPYKRSKSQQKAVSTYFFSGQLGKEYLTSPFPSYEEITRNIDPNLNRSRAETLFHSPAISWLEQRSNRLLGKASNSDQSPISRLLDWRKERGRQAIYDWSSTKNGTIGISSWIDRAPFSITTINASTQIKQDCVGHLTRRKLLQRGHFTPWAPTLEIGLSRKVLNPFFIPKLQTLIAKAPQSGSKNFYFHLESSDLIIFSLSPIDLALHQRFFLAAVGALLLIRTLSRNTTEGNKIARKRCFLMLANVVILSGLLTGSLALLEIILLNTKWLDESSSRNPSYMPPRDSLRYEEDMRERFLLANEYGFIDDPVETYDQSKNPCKIAVLGDSFVWGYGGGGHNKERWTSQLQGLIPHCKIMHWGIGGWSTEDQVAFMKRRGIKHKVNLLILGFVDNDMNFTEDQEPKNKETISRLKDLLGDTPWFVLFTPWSGSTTHRITFSKASKLFNDQGIKNYSCLREVQSITGIGDAPRHMWIGADVDRHPGTPITTAIAKCALARITPYIYTKNQSKVDIPKSIEVKDAY